MNNRGSSLILVLGIALVMLTTVFALNYWLSRDRLIKEYYRNNEQAYYLAEAGIEEALWYLSGDYYWSENWITENFSEVSFYSTNIINLNYVNPPPTSEEEQAGLMLVELDSIGTHQSSRERIFTLVEITYYYETPVVFNTISWERRPP